MAEDEDSRLLRRREDDQRFRTYLPIFRSLWAFEVLLQLLLESNTKCVDLSTASYSQLIRQHILNTH